MHGQRPDLNEAPEWKILLLLAVHIGLPYFLLSTVSPIIQGWFGLKNKEASPYRLYAVSNAGSLLALLSYPFVIEPMLPLGEQTWWWSAAFVCACVFLAITAFVSRTGGQLSSDDSSSFEKVAAPRFGTMFYWFAYAACGSVLLLAVTNHVCYDIAVVPFFVGSAA